MVHALGDATGKEIMRALIERVRSAPNCDAWERTFTIDLLTHEGACVGAVVWNAQHGKTIVWAKRVILATGGAQAEISMTKSNNEDTVAVRNSLLDIVLSPCFLFVQSNFREQYIVSELQNRLWQTG